MTCETNKRVGFLLLLISPTAIADGPMLTGSGIMIFAVILIPISILMGYLGGLFNFRRWAVMLFCCYSLPAVLLVLVSDLLDGQALNVILIGGGAALLATASAFLGHVMGSPRRSTDSPPE